MEFYELTDDLRETFISHIFQGGFFFASFLIRFLFLDFFCILTSIFNFRASNF